MEGADCGSRSARGCDVRQGSGEPEAGPATSVSYAHDWQLFFVPSNSGHRRQVRRLPQKTTQPRQTALRQESAPGRGATSPYYFSAHFWASRLVHHGSSYFNTPKPYSDNTGPRVPSNVVFTSPSRLCRRKSSRDYKGNHHTNAVPNRLLKRWVPPPWYSNPASGSLPSEIHFFPGRWRPRVPSMDLCSLSACVQHKGSEKASIR